MSRRQTLSITNQRVSEDSLQARTPPTPRLQGNVGVDLRKSYTSPTIERNPFASPCKVLEEVDVEIILALGAKKLVLEWHVQYTQG